MPSETVKTLGRQKEFGEKKTRSCSQPLQVAPALFPDAMTSRERER